MQQSNFRFRHVLSDSSQESRDVECQGGREKNAVVVKDCCEKSRRFFVCLGYLRALESKNVQIHNCVVVFMLRSGRRKQV